MESTEGSVEGQDIATNINDLPVEVLLQVFSFFTPKQLCSLVAPVCTKWHQLSRDPALWRKLTLKQNSEQSFEKLFRSAPFQHLRILTVECCIDRCDSLITLVSEHCPSLTKFAYNYNYYNRITVTSESLEALAAGCPHITQFLFPVNVISDRKYGVFEKFPELKVLSLKFHLDSAGEEISLVNCKQLEQLNAWSSHPPASAEFSDRFRIFLSNHQHLLTSLDERHCETLQANVYLELSKCIYLQELTLMGVSFLADHALKTITVNLKQLQELEVIGSVPNGDQLTSIGLISAFSVENSLTKLTSLSLSLGFFIAVNDKVVTAIANRFTLQLRRLSLLWCTNVTDKGVLAVLAKCTKLRDLDLSYLRRLTGGFLRSIPMALPQLKRRIIRGCLIVDQELIQVLKNACPDLIIH